MQAEGLLLAGGSLERGAPSAESYQHQDTSGNSTEYARNEGSFWGKMMGSLMLFPPLRVRTEVSGAGVRRRERTMERKRQDLWFFL